MQRNSDLEFWYRFAASELGLRACPFDSGGGLRGHNTDYAAATDSLCQAMGIARVGLKGRTVAVLGAGGAARAIVAALAHYHAETTVYNRTFEVIPMLLVAVVWYLLVTSVLNVGQGMIERRYARGSERGQVA